MIEEARGPWWRGARGEWYVVAQVALIALVFFGPRTIRGIGRMPAVAHEISTGIGVMLLVSGGFLLLAGIVALRRSLTPLPYPRAGGDLIETGPYRIVRHPMYAGGVILSAGWAFLVHSWLTLGYTAALFVFLEVKSTREERWLTERYSGYAGYQQRVPKLIPFLQSRRKREREPSAG